MAPSAVRLTFYGDAVPPEKRTAHEKLLRKPAQSTAQEVSDSWQSEGQLHAGHLNESGGVIVEHSAGTS